MSARWIALALLLGLQTPAQPQFGQNRAEYASGWTSMSDAESRASWSELQPGWTFDGPTLRRAAETTKHIYWHGVLREFEIEFEWRENPSANTAWQPGRIVVRADNSCLGLLGQQRTDRSADSDLASFCVGPFEITQKQSKRGWRIALMPGETLLELRGMNLRDNDKMSRHGETVRLFDGKTLAGWRALGDAKWSVQDGELVGEVGGESQSFLCSEKSFWNFILDVDVKNDLPGNSGIQVRSHENEQKHLFGYQIEIDPSSRAWSGGLYDEARRGWLQDLSNNPLGRAAFKNGEWNHYRIECVAARIRAWVNDVPTADYLDARDLDGVIGLQVHSGKDTRVRWRNFVMRELGISFWQGFKDGFDGQHCSVDEDGADLRLHYQAPPAASDQKELNGETITLSVNGWTQVIPLETLPATGCEVLILGTPPRMAIEIDGRRQPMIRWTPPSDAKAQAQHGMSVSWEGPWKLESAQRIFTTFSSRVR